MGVIHIGRTLVRAVIRRWRGSGHEASACNAHATVIDYCVGWVARYGPHRFVSWTPNVPSTTGISARRWKRLRRFFGGRWGLRLCLGFGFPFALLTTLGTSIFKPNLCDGNHHQLSLLTCEISLELHLFHITLWSLPEAAFSRQTSKLEFTFKKQMHGQKATLLLLLVLLLLSRYKFLNISVLFFVHRLPFFNFIHRVFIHQVAQV